MFCSLHAARRADLKLSAIISATKPAREAHPEGLELSTDLPNKAVNSKKGGAGGGARSSISDPELCFLAERWSQLLPEIKQQILALTIRCAKPPKDS